jgi:glutamate carboxypeptidase
MLALLEALVRAESPTDVPEAQEEAQRVLATALEDLGFAVRWVMGDRQDDGGEDRRRRHLYARPDAATGWRERGRPVQLVLGHSDTVWSRGTIERMPFEVDREEGVVRGPGVFDMKGGLTQMVFALQALRAVEADLAVTPVVFVNSDEEQGSPTSERHVRRLAQCAHRAFVAEPALGLGGKIKTARKGSGRFVVAVKGKSAHAGLDPEAGSSAILELSHVVQALHALNDPEAGLTVNVGTIDGGTRPNVVAAESRAEVDVRVRTQEQAERVERAIRDLQATVPGTTLEVTGGVGRPPMERTPASRRLWQQAQEAAEVVGVGPLEEGRSGGVSDGNVTAQYTPTLDGLGAVGDGAHAEHEFCFVDQMVERSALLAALLATPPLPDST